MLLERARGYRGGNLRERGSRSGALPPVQRRRESWAEHLLWVSRNAGAKRWWEGSHCEEADLKIISPTKLQCCWWFRNVLLTVIGSVMGATTFFSWCF